MILQQSDQGIKTYYGPFFLSFLKVFEKIGVGLSHQGKNAQNNGRGRRQIRIITAIWTPIHSNEGQLAFRVSQLNIR